jgi:hypothetical protein
MNNFLPAGGIHTETVRDRYFFLLAGNLTDIRCFTTVMILSYEQVKIYSFYYINYDCIDC